MHKTGEIWQKSPRSRAQVVRRVCEALKNTYGLSRLGNPRKPLNDLVYIIISNRTTPKTARRIYSHIKQQFKTWDDVLSSPPSVLRSVIQPAGLAKVRSQQIQTALQKIKQDFGSCSLSQLKGQPTNTVQKYLVSLPGVSKKVAKCVMMYTMNAQVLPVDSHVHRIAKRLGWTSRSQASQCHDELESIVPPKYRYAFHVDCILHGRSICRPRKPTCHQCCISRHCLYRQSVEETYHSRKTTNQKLPNEL